MNPYDPYVANMETLGGKLTVLWYVDDLKVSCKNGFKIAKLFVYLDKIYGNKLVSHRGKKGDYLGMNLDFLRTGYSP